MTSFELIPRGPFSLAAGAAFLVGFSPAAYRGAEAGHLHLAFVPDGEETAAGVCLRQPDGVVVGEAFGEADPEAVRDQVARILSLDVDGTGFPEVGERDPVVGRLQERWPGLRPVGFCSPYEAAAWALICHRIRMIQAARIKARMATELGQAVDIHGDVRHAFPGPGRLAALEGFPGLFDRKVENLRALGVEAVEGRLDGAWLRGLPRDQALKELKQLQGIGDFSAELVLLRGAGDPDHLPLHEPRLCRGAALAYDLDEPPDRDWLEQRAEAWRPYRTWVVLLLRVLLEAETGDVAGTRNVGTRQT
ncbi:MAG TPA: DNA-3-methyladenine glycosylase 2 family protein [Actinomycetes bacterium]|nr:DNA-3-methyladenine glycosylase 2 family protein [Actinomycetes bacterium]